MVLEDFLFPGEVIKYQSPGKVRYADDWFNFYVTDQRIIAHKQHGLIFKKDRVISERLEDISTVSYDEKGILSKKGILRIQTIEKRMAFEGKASDMKALWQELQKFIKRPAPALHPSPPTVKEREVIKEVVMVPCSYCGALMHQTLTFCPNCGAKRR